MKSFGITIIALITTVTAYASSSEDERERIKELDEICIQVRSEKIKEAQKEKIELCVNVDNLERAYCERYFKGYGWGSKTASGNRNVRLFDQIPECIEAFNARKNRER